MSLRSFVLEPRYGDSNEFVLCVSLLNLKIIRELLCRLLMGEGYVGRLILFGFVGFGSSLKAVWDRQAGVTGVS